MRYWNLEEKEKSESFNTKMSGMVGWIAIGFMVVVIVFSLILAL